MKLTFLLVFISCLQASATGYGQSITISVKDATLKEVFKKIEKQSDYHFYYKTEDIQGKRIIQLDVKNEPLMDVLKKIFFDQLLVYNIVEKNIIVSPKPSNEVQGEQFQLTITGTVLDAESREPLSGASVVIKGKGNGTSTDKSGKFSIGNVPDNATLVISFINYDSKEVKVSKSENITVLLNRKITKIDEVLINTGLFERPKNSFTGAVTTVSGDELRNVNSLNVLQALKVFDPSVHIPDNIQFGSDPNKLPDITLRGTNNFPVQGESAGSDVPVSGADFSANYMSNPNQPIFILDGFEVSIQKIYDLDMSRIASFTILKDAAATAIYGSRAANGVIVVETVQPKSGKLRVSYSGLLQITAPDLTVYNLTDAREKLEVEKLAGMYDKFSDGIRPDLDAASKMLYAQRRAAVEEGVNTYWLSQPVQTGIGQRHSLYLEGGDSYIRYGVSFGYNNVTGVMKNSGRNTYSGGMSLSYRHKKLLIKNDLNVEFNQSKNSNYGAFSQYTRMNPYWRPFDEQGQPTLVLEDFYDPNTSFRETYLNPLYNITLHTVDKATYTNLVNRTYLEWKINNDFKLSGKVALTRQVDQSDLFNPAKHTEFYDETDFTRKGRYTQGYGQFFAYEASVQLDTKKNIGEGVLFNTTGVGLGQTSSSSTSTTVLGFPNERMDDIGLGNGYGENSKPTGGNSITRRISFFSNFNYTYKFKYLADFSVSADGSSQFGVNSRFAPFWSASLGWNVQKESIFANSSWLNLLKLRASIGTTGDSRFPPFMGITTYKYYTDQNYRGLVGAALMGFGNENLHWQETLKKNVGFDLGLFDNRFSFTFNAYIENTSGLILDINTPPSVGVNSYKENVGKLKNTGYEFYTTIFLLKKPQQKLYWNVFLNGNHNRNQIVVISNSLKKLNEENDKNDQTRPQYRFEEGQSTSVIWAVKSHGIDPSTGRELFEKRDGSLTYNWDPADKEIVGDQTPDMIGNFGTTVSYHDFTVSFYFNYKYGGQLYNQTLQSRVEGADLDYNVDKRVLLGRWKQQGDQAFFQRLLVDRTGDPLPTYATSRFVQDENYIQAASISLSYQLPDRIAKKFGASNTRIGFIANDLKRWESVQSERGLDYPFARNFTINLTTSFQ